MSLSHKAFQVTGSPLLVEASILFAPGHLDLPLECRELDESITVEYHPGEVVELYEKLAIIHGRTEHFFVDHRGIVHTHDEVRLRKESGLFSEVA